jgi:hypothetical protein
MPVIPKCGRLRHENGELSFRPADPISEKEKEIEKV